MDMSKLSTNKILEEVIPQKMICETRLNEDKQFYSMLQKQRDENIELQSCGFPIKSFDILDVLEKYGIMRNILWECENHAIHQERILNEREDRDDVAIQTLKKSRDRIFDKMNMIEINSSSLIKRRDFMPLLCSTFTEHSNDAFFAESHLWFLGDDFIEINPLRNKYKKIILTEREFNFLRKLFFSADTPGDFVAYIGQFVNVDPKRVAICSFEAKYTGFIVAHKEDEELSNKLGNYSRDFPDSLYPLKSELHNNILILNLMENSILETDIINNFDIWVDLNTLVIYAKVDLFPIKANLDIQLHEYYNTDYAHFTFFDYSFEKNRINIEDLRQLILKENPFQNPDQFYLYDGSSFISIQSDYIESHCNILLIQYTITEYFSNLIVFDLSKHEICDNINFMSFEKDIYINLYNDALSLLELNVIDS